MGFGQINRRFDLLRLAALILLLLICMAPAWSAELLAIRGSFLDLQENPWELGEKEADAARFVADGMLVIEDGIIKDFGEYKEVLGRYPKVKITEYRGRLITPGFIDGHIHCPQTRVLGAYGHELLEWLQQWIYPEELKYRDREYARQGTKNFFDNLLAGGTTTCQAFTTSSPVSTEEFFEEASRRNMRVIGGLTGIDRNAPADFLNTPEQFYSESKRLIEKYHGTGRNLYAITPRFAYGASPELMDSCRKLKKEYPDLWVNTHISENPHEVRGVVAAFPGCNDYLAVYEKYDLVGPKFSGGHGVWLSDSEFARISQKGAAVVFCPLSNLFLGSGLFRIGKATDPAHRVRLAFGTDMGGGNRFSMLNVLDEAYKVGMCNHTRLDGSVDPSRQDLAEADRNKISPYKGLWSVTLGGAQALYLDKQLGNFEPGKEADFLVLDWSAGQRALKWHQSLVAEEGKAPENKDKAAQLFFGLMAVGGDRCVEETWVMGKQAYKRP